VALLGAARPSHAASAVPPTPAPPLRALDAAGGAPPDTAAGDTTGFAAYSAAQSEGRPISRVEIEPRNIFDPIEPGRMSSLLKLANRLHTRTRRQTVREQLLFKPGDPWWDARGRESARNLRTLDFLEPWSIEPRRDGDSVIVKVVTRDAWSTRPEFNIESASGQQFGAIGLTELNFMGLGKALSFFYRELPSGRSRSMSYSDPSLLSTRVRLRFGAATGSSGVANEFYIGQPYYAEDAPNTYSFGWTRQTSVSSLYENGQTLVNFNRRYEQSEIAYGIGRRTRGTVRRLTAYYDALERRLGPSDVLVTTPVPPEFIGGEESVRLRRLSLEGRWWQPDFIERRKINRFGLVEDFDIGTSASLRMGYAPKAIGSTQDEGYARAGFDEGLLTDFGFGTLTSSLETRFHTTLLETIGQLDARWYEQPSTDHTLVLAARGVAGTNVPRDFQVIIGGLNGLRAYPVQALAGTRAWRLNAEDRWTVGERFWESVTLGAVAFVDAARAWGPGSDGSAWYVDAGTGVRISLPQWSLGQALRIDVAWPIQPSRGGSHRAVLTFGSSQAF